MSPALHPGTLHILNKAPGHSRFITCLANLTNQDTLVLTENAVLAASDADTKLPEGTVALGADIEARGLSDAMPVEKQIDHQQLVRLTEQYARIISW
ncbi:sulfurtransferase complex subunit TusB [Marinobacter sp.]|uniref:sulfurtransferase complex subunit TusB n=1 Tax=Marinobacter sp. TaxID=50741 RepID=UPI0019F3311A|nr:sulfurtransferase complex subunit TusB [Marinobacter sp.]MBE0484836.1 sulfurtransferase complex subunit TusB [Marinobacter sp.]